LRFQPPLTYANYLDLEKLLTIQKPRSAPVEHDETVNLSDAGAAAGALPTR
jgi:tryptophan 2,3-dioxygenase